MASIWLVRIKAIQNIYIYLLTVLFATRSSKLAKPTGLARLLCTRGTEGYNDFLHSSGTAASPERPYSVRRYHSPLPRILGVVILDAELAFVGGEQRRQRRSYRARECNNNGTGMLDLGIGQGMEGKDVAYWSITVKRRGW